MVKDAVPLGECRRALVLKLAPQAEVAFAAPVLNVLKAHAPRLEIDALVYDAAAAVLAGHPALAQLHLVGSGEGFLSRLVREAGLDRKSTRLNSSHSQISYAVFCLK